MNKSFGVFSELAVANLIVDSFDNAMLGQTQSKEAGSLEVEKNKWLSLTVMLINLWWLDSGHVNHTYSSRDSGFT